MPRNAIATELVDSILPVADIPGQIITYRDRISTVSIPDEAKDRPDGDQNALRDIFTNCACGRGMIFRIINGRRYSGESSGE